MVILALDSAGAGCNVCVWCDGHVLAQAAERMDRGQDQRLMPLILDVMQKAGMDFAELDRIAVTRGPGSFTGLRIGLAAARGIGLAARKPVVGIDRFSIYRRLVPTPNNNLLVAIDSRRRELFCRLYPKDGAAPQDLQLSTDETDDFAARTGETIITGDIEISGTFYQAVKNFEATACASLAAEADIEKPEFLPRPLYIRPPDVTFPKEAGSR